MPQGDCGLTRNPIFTSKDFMNTESIEKAFVKMGADVRFGEPGPWSRNFTVNVNRAGVFLINSGIPVEFSVLDLKPKDRHLLLMARYKEAGARNETKNRYLMGHDERHWFVSEISAPVSSVEAAKQSLKPSEVVEVESGLKTKNRHRRRNAAWLRQGEWFFVPAPSYQPDPNLILRDEPLIRGRGSKPHMCQELFRMGGETVYVSRRHPDGLSQKQYDDLSEKELRAQSWQVMKRNPTVYVRGKIRHADHATLILPCWHRVYVNREMLSATGTVAFLD
jgi:hypothetical protein